MIRDGWPGRPLRLVPGDARTIGLVWVLTRLFVVAAAIAAQWAVIRAEPVTGFLGSWNYFETLWYADIARNGYVGEGEFAYNSAYFPGTALVMRAGLGIGLDPVATGLIASFIAGFIAMIALGRLARGSGMGAAWPVVAICLSPMAVFLAAPWSEALFAAFAFSAWVAARGERWWLAGSLAGAAAIIRVNGLFLALALLVAWWMSSHRRVRDLLPLGIPFAVLGAHVAYLASVTGSWTAWLDAHRHWDRQFTDPVTSLRNTIDLIWTFTPGVVSTRFIAEILAVAVLVGFTAVLLLRRWWAEAVYVGLTVLSLATSTFYYSVPRTAVVLFPIWIVAGSWLQRWRGLRWAYVILATPAMLLIVALFAQGQWIS